MLADACIDLATADSLLDYPAHFDLLSLPLPEGRDAILSALEADSLIARGNAGRWNITRLGAVLFAHRAFKDMDKADRIRACYLQRDVGMTFASLKAPHSLGSGTEATATGTEACVVPH